MNCSSHLIHLRPCNVNVIFSSHYLSFARPSTCSTKEDKKIPEYLSPICYSTSYLIVVEGDGRRAGHFLSVVRVRLNRRFMSMREWSLLISQTFYQSGYRLMRAKKRVAINWKKWPPRSWPSCSPCRIWCAAPARAKWRHSRNLRSIPLPEHGANTGC